MIFKYNKQINRKKWESTIKYKEMFGMEFPDKILVTQQDEKIAKEKALEFSAFWDEDKEMEAGIFKIYKYKLPKTLKCYIVTTKTSAMDPQKKAIYLSIYAPIDKIPMVIIHEFSHIAFWIKWNKLCKKIGYTENGIQELKEVLTVINNLEYSNISDKGYIMHQELRKIVKKMWLANKSLTDIISTPEIIRKINLLNTIKRN